MRLYKRALTHIILFGLISIMLFFITGCGGNTYDGLSDDASSEAKLEEAIILIDNRKYEKAIDVLEDLDQTDPKVLRALASAYAGQSGFDVVNLLEIIDTIRESSDAGDSSIEIIGTVLGGDDKTLSTSEIISKLENMSDSIEIYENLLALDPDNDNTITQLGIISMTHIVLQIANFITLDLDSDDILLTEDGIRDSYPDNDFQVPDGENLDYLNDNIDRMEAAARTIESTFGDGEENAEEELDEFIDKLDNDGNGTISISDLENYINDEI